jgi:hypothetical protein
VQSKDIIDVLKNEEAISFITRHLNDDLSTISLKYSNKTSFNITICLQLMSIYKKCQKKIPLVSSAFLAIDQRSYEQCSSEAIARYKATFITGNSLLDITGGIGIDSLFIAQHVKKIDVIENNAELHNLALYNVAKLAIKNITRIHDDGVAHITSNYDWIYIDPDRRVGKGRAVVLSLLSPDVLAIMPQLRKYANKIYIKLSPLFDINEVWRVFECVALIHLIAERGEVKEVGVLLDLNRTTNTKMVKLHDVYTHFEANIDLSYVISTPETRDKIMCTYLCVPLALVSKSYSMNHFLKGVIAFKHVSFNLYFTSDAQIRGFKSYKIVAKCPLTAKKVRTILEKENVKQLNIVVKGLNDTPAQWHKKLKTKDGGDYYLFILKGNTYEAILTQATSEQI